MKTSYLLVLVGAVAVGVYLYRRSRVEEPSISDRVIDKAAATLKDAIA